MERPVQVPVAELDDDETPAVRRTTNLAVHTIKATRTMTVPAVPRPDVKHHLARALSSGRGPKGTRSALDRFRETPIVDRRVRDDVPPHPLPSGERLFWIFPSTGRASRLRRCSRVVSISLRRLLARMPVCDVCARTDGFPFVPED